MLRTNLTFSVYLVVMCRGVSNKRDLTLVARPSRCRARGRACTHPGGGGGGFMDDLIAFLVREEQRLYVRSARGIDVGMKEQP